jgi:hypothetical protein
MRFHTTRDLRALIASNQWHIELVKNGNPHFARTDVSTLRRNIKELNAELVRRGVRP